MKRPEQELQIRAVKFIRAAYPDLLFFHVPNGGVRSKVEGAIFKAMGTMAGAPDLMFVLPTGVAAFLELKAGKGKLTATQEAFRDRCQSAGAFWAEARSLEEIEEQLHRWLQPLGWVPKARIAA